MAHFSSRYLDLVSGRSRGSLSTAALAILSLLALFYRGAVGVRNCFYNFLRFASRRVGRPVISIGNITVGGTGKTPTAAKIAHLLLARGRKVAILSRGYKGTSIPFDEENRDAAAAQLSAAGDEARVLKRRCPRATVYLNPDRVASARQAIREGADCLILDDGFQHRRIARDLDIVLIDATTPFGFGRILPRGLLREPLASLERSNLILLTRSDEVTEAAKAEALRLIQKAAPGTPVVHAVQRIHGFADVKGRVVEGAEASSMQAVIFAGVGNFESFRRSVERLGVKVLAAYEFPDHHYYTTDELDGLAETATTQEANVLLTTEKDAVKLVGRWNESWAPLLVLNLEIEFVGDGDKILSEAIDRAMHESRTSAETNA